MVRMDAVVLNLWSPFVDSLKRTQSAGAMGLLHGRGSWDLPHPVGAARSEESRGMKPGKRGSREGRLFGLGLRIVLSPKPIGGVHQEQLANFL